MKNAAPALLALLIAGPAMAASEMTAGDLYSLCASADENDLTACRFYVFGVVQGVILASTMTANRKFVEKNNTVICLPDAVSRNQMVAIVRDTLRMTFVLAMPMPRAAGRRRRTSRSIFTSTHRSLPEAWRLRAWCRLQVVRLDQFRRLRVQAPRCSPVAAFRARRHRSPGAAAS